jgi:transcription initiation factor TFIID subunit 3
LKKRHSKTGEESRYQGTALGKDAELQSVGIVGGPAGSIAEWKNQFLASRKNSSLTLEGEAATPATSGISSAPLTPIESE